MPHVSSRLIALGAALALIGVPAIVVRAAQAPAHAHAARQSACDALGTYQVGPRLLPMAASPRRRTAPPATPRAGAGSAPAIIAWPAWLLRGTMTISAYSGCGSPTQGTFNVSRAMVGPPIERSNRGSAPSSMPCAMPCWQPPLGVLSATGTFSQDTAHGSDATYVLVSATITSSRPGPQLGRPCAIDVCPSPVAITSTVSFTDVTGYLQVGATGSQAATLSFLPPPAAGTALAPAPMILEGWKGAAKP